MNGLIWKDGSHLGDTVKEVENNLQIVLRGYLLEYDFVQLDTFIKPENEHHKWRAVSALQKAIRRGDVTTALRMANALHGLDWTYIWRRMAIIALEDIGVADIELVAATVWVCGKGGWRMKNGGCIEYLYMLVDRMCRSVKDRSVCDLVCWADWGPDLADFRKTVFGLPCNFGPEKITNSDMYLAHRMLHAWAMCGTKAARAENIPEGHGGSFALFMAMLQNSHMQMPAAVEMICTLGISKTGDAMPIAYPFVYEMARSGVKQPNLPPPIGAFNLAWEADDLTDLPMLGNYPSEAFDQHCREGRKAIKYFVKSCIAIRQFTTGACGIPIEDKDRFHLPASILVFRAEGSLVDKRLVFPGSKDLFDIAEMALNTSQGVPGKFNDYGMRLVRANLASLHYARKLVLDMLPQGQNVKPPDAVYVFTDDILSLQDGTATFDGAGPLMGMVTAVQRKKADFSTVGASPEASASFIAGGMTAYGPQFLAEQDVPEPPAAAAPVPPKKKLVIKKKAP